MKMIIVLDLGTTSTKTALLDEQGTISAEFSIDTPTMFDKNRMEIDQNILWNGILNMIAKLNRVVKKGDTLAGITISSMSNSIIPVDRQGRSLHFALSWLDKRPYEKYVVPFLKRFIEGYSIPSCGQYPLAMYPAFKIAWYRENFPEKNKNVFKWVNISDFIYAKMLGQTDQYFCDYSIASRYMLFDDNKKKWNPHALKEFSIDESLLPSPVCAGSILGNAGPELRKLGINSSAKIIMGAHDHICASICANIHSTEKILHSTGTSEVLTTIFQGKNNTLPPKKWLNVESSIDNNEKYLVAFCSASGQIFKSFSSALKSNNCLEDKKILSAQDTFS
jgi:sugar (pentulose or hexulose) kinase